MYTISRRYLPIICAANFGIILAKPELPSSLVQNGLAFSTIIGWYLVIGVVGLFLNEIWLTSRRINESKLPRDTFRRIFVGYTIIGFMLFIVLLFALLRSPNTA